MIPKILQSGQIGIALTSYVTQPFAVLCVWSVIYLSCECGAVMEMVCFSDEVLHVADIICYREKKRSAFRKCSHG